ncbi:MAG: aspartate kinase [Acidobacteriia bacterium]|nr:aspartate kinase [Terriglobia bacterium]
MIVMKFGGSSVASAAAIERVAGIVKSHIEVRPVVVVSAMGTTTDRLVEALQYASQGFAYSAWRRLEDLRRYHIQETQRLLGCHARKFIETHIAPKFQALHALLVEIEEGKKLTPELQDKVLSYGERLSSAIIAAAFERSGIHCCHVDATEVIITDEQHLGAAPIYSETYARLRRTVAKLARNRVVVMGGFIGATRNGIATTLGRGGSDLSASIVGAGISADEIQIWTDVDGMLTSDPRVFHGAYRLRSLGYDEAEEMARLGAKVLCPRTVQPAMRQGIPIVIRNARHPEGDGTRIGAQTPRPSTVKAIVSKTGMTTVHLFVTKLGMLPCVSTGLSDLFERNQVHVEMVQAQPDGVSFALESSPRLAELLQGVDRSVRITVQERTAVVSLIGDTINSDEAILKRALSAILNDSGVRMVSQGGSQKSLRFAVPESKLRVTVENLHREFFRSADPEIFASTPGSDRTLFTRRFARIATEAPANAHAVPVR